MTLAEWKNKLEQAFYKLDLVHRFGCEIDQTDSCTCGAIDDRTTFKLAMGAFFLEAEKHWK